MSGKLMKLTAKMAGLAMLMTLPCSTLRTQAQEQPAGRSPLPMPVDLRRAPLALPSCASWKGSTPAITQERERVFPRPPRAEELRLHQAAVSAGSPITISSSVCSRACVFATSM